MGACSHSVYATPRAADLQSFAAEKLSENCQNLGSSLLIRFNGDDIIRAVAEMKHETQRDETMKKGSYKVAGRFVSDDDIRVNSQTLGITVWQRGDVCVVRLGNGTEGRGQLTDHGAGHKSVQVFGADGMLMTDIDTRF